MNLSKKSCVEERSAVVASVAVVHSTHAKTGSTNEAMTDSNSVADDPVSNTHSSNEAVSNTDTMADGAVSKANSSKEAVSDTDSVADSNSMTEASNNSVANESRGDNTDSPHPVGADTMGGAGVVSNSSDR